MYGLLLGASWLVPNILIPIFQSQAVQLKAEYLELSENLIHIHLFDLFEFSSPLMCRHVGYLITNKICAL